MLRALVLILTGILNGLFCVLRPTFYWDNPRLRTLRRWLGDTPVMLLSLTISVLSVGSGIYLFDRNLDETRLAEISLALKDGNADSAAHALEEFVGEYPTNTAALLLLGTVQHNSGQPRKAEATYRRVIEIDPGAVRPYIGLGMIAMASARLEEAERFFRQALENDSTNAEIYSNLALLDLKRYRDAQGLANAQRAFELDQRSPLVTANLAVAYHYNGRIQERNLMMHAAVTLGFGGGEFLARVFDGSLTIRDERYAPGTPPPSDAR
jgi:tetratricopeptide (TPR) repeat protein